MLGEILGAVGSIAGGLLGNKAADKANKQAQANRKEDIALQREFAQNSIQWKANDAKAAGISKLAALGATPSSYSPVSTGSTSSDYSFLGSAGQNLGRAAQAGLSNTQQATATSKQITAIQLEGAQLDNDIKRAQINSMLRTQAQAGTPPGIPVPGVGEIDRKTKVDAYRTDSPGWVPQSTPEGIEATTNSGATTQHPAPAIQEAMESAGAAAQGQYFMRSGIAPLFNKDRYPPSIKAALSKDPSLWAWFNPITGEYSLHKKRGYQYAPRVPVNAKW